MSAGGGGLDYSSIDRNIPLGAAVRTESGETRGYEYTARLLGGYWFKYQDLLHGPYVRLTYTKASVDPYSETGSDSTALAYGEQNREQLLWGLGWQVWMDGMEITQFTYFQQVGGIDLDPISAEITYGLDRIAMAIQGTSSVQELKYASNGQGGYLSWADLWLQNEIEFSKYNFEEANVEQLFAMFKMWEGEAARLFALELVMPGFDCVIKCSHLFNLLDARGAISVSERVGYIGRVRKLARQAALAYLAKREAMGFPMLPREQAPVEGAVS